MADYRVTDQTFDYLHGIFEKFYTAWHLEKKQMFLQYNAGIKKSVSTVLNRIDATIPTSEILIPLWLELKTRFAEIQQGAQFRSYADFKDKDVLSS
ncbi:MAG: hypothetical protein HQ517_07925 [SAR324 cluster bacterium]|nr:hypothetical protein [SAR324 cluster bacterium]